LVVGGGPVGLCAAIRAKQADLGVVLIDRSRTPTDKACGEGLMPDGASLLRNLGIEPESLPGASFCGIRYIEGGVVAEGTFRGAKGYGIRRPDLHRALTNLAEEVGVDLRWGVAATRLERDGVHTDAGPIGARWVIAADGLHSRLRRWSGLSRPRGRHVRFGVRRHYAARPWSNFVEVYWGDGCEAYVTPVGPNCTNVALLWEGEKARFDDLLVRFPVLEHRLAGARIDSRDRGAGPLEQRVGRVVRGNLALVGDASGFVDAISGEGLSTGFRHAFAVVDAIGAGDLNRYAAAHRRIERLPGMLTRSLLFLERHPGLRRRVLQVLSSDGGLFSRLLAVHTRSSPAWRLAFDGIRLAWQVSVGRGSAGLSRSNRNF
jgi:flavin-dependent dehydrogenase